MSGNWTRRQALRRGGAAAAGVAGLGLAGYAGYAWPHPDSTAGTHPAATDAPSPAAARPGADNPAAVDHFVTRSDISIEPAPGLIPRRGGDRADRHDPPGAAQPGV